MEQLVNGLNGRIALVTGGGRGIGKAIALALAREGAEVVVAARSNGEIASVAAEIEAAGARTLAVTLDVSRPDDVRRAFAFVRERVGEVDILVNNAGIGRSALLWRTTDEIWESTITTNLSGTFYCMREALGPMVERRWGRIVNIASVAGKTGAPYISAYVASKHAVVGLTRAAAVEVAKHNVTVNAICPGYVDTPMTDGSIANIVDKTGLNAEQARAKLEAQSPQGRIVEPEEVAYLTLMLVRDEAKGINGQSINLDGGGVTS
jgi:NAD(P)-dependent dehydrogenase (short-subunit alcohol dehydrogenase family)